MNVSFQLYSARDAGPWAETLTMLSGLGYTQVEGFGGVYDDPAAFRALLDANGLTMPSGHFFPVGNFEGGLDKTLTTAKALGMNRVFCPAPEDDLRGDTPDLAAWKALAHRLEEAAKKVRDAGLAFGWHNHHWEFMGNSPAMEVILQEAPSIDWEMDVAWVVRGGGNPLDWIEKYKDRITTAHVKDIAPAGDCADEDGWADVGQGTMDWAGIMSALRGAGVDLFVMEHDKPSDATRFARRSIDAFRGY
ncbi:sugar phosphate isomerase/epimerase family protein [Tropicibacter oceani]|uniref:Sugar phosphate isomerase/epimerase n=1 Tax=Tropicibacter oceani TaxID=3058420 RepID=A0ABY8QNP0_9RHOB|nr:sugar phosphate isomerase/epimerase [Tropicibacter oceani]WGW05568.1 sugar phosphate isomerase/epimerase [Tropicibacter oceani]